MERGGTKGKKKLTQKLTHAYTPAERLRDERRFLLMLEIKSETEFGMREQDTYKFQTDRLKKLVTERAPGKEISFDEASTFIRFRITDPVTGVELVEPKGQGWFPGELADKSDDVLWAMIVHLSNGKLGMKLR